jgi:hypothetical protein
MQLVTIIEQRPVLGGIIVVEALILGLVLGGVLYSKNINPIGAIVAGAAAASLYGYFFTRKRRIAMVMNAIASLGWALITAGATRGLWHTGNSHDWVWGWVAAAVGFAGSWKAHRSGAAELREADGQG